MIKQVVSCSSSLSCSLSLSVAYLYHTNNRAPASSHPTNYLVDLCWLVVQLTHSFLVHYQRHEHHRHLTMTSIHSESFCRFSGSPRTKKKTIAANYYNGTSHHNAHTRICNGTYERSTLHSMIHLWRVKQEKNNNRISSTLTPAGLDERSWTTVVEFDGDKNWTSRDFDALAEFKCSAVRVTVVCKSSSKLSEKKNKLKSEKNIRLLNEIKKKKWLLLQVRRINPIFNIRQSFCAFFSVVVLPSICKLAEHIAFQTAPRFITNSHKYNFIFSLFLSVCFRIIGVTWLNYLQLRECDRPYTNAFVELFTISHPYNLKWNKFAECQALARSLARSER